CHVRMLLPYVPTLPSRCRWVLSGHAMRGRVTPVPMRRLIGVAPSHRVRVCVLGWSRCQENTHLIGVTLLTGWTAGGLLPFARWTMFALGGVRGSRVAVSSR